MRLTLLGKCSPREEHRIPTKVDQLFSFGRLSLVYSCCWWCSPEERTDPPASEVVRFVLVEGQSGIVCAIRTSNFSLEFTRSLHGAIDEQARLVIFFGVG